MLSIAATKTGMLLMDLIPIVIAVASIVGVVLVLYILALVVQVLRLRIRAAHKSHH